MKNFVWNYWILFTVRIFTVYKMKYSVQTFYTTSLKIALTNDNDQWIAIFVPWRPYFTFAFPPWELHFSIIPWKKEHVILGWFIPSCNCVFFPWQVATAHMNLGAMLHYNSKHEEAEQSYLAALRLKPDDTVTQTNLKKLRNLMHRAKDGGRR